MLWYDFTQIIVLMFVWTLIFRRLGIIYERRNFWLFFFALHTATELASIPLASLGINNLWLYNISKPIQFLFIVVYMLKVLHVIPKNFVGIISISMLAALSVIIITPPYAYSSLGEVVFAAVVVSLCIAYYYQLINNPSSIDLKTSEFWFCSSLFIYYGSSLCINGSLDFFIENNRLLATKLFYGLVINSYLLYAVTAYAIWSSQFIKQREY